MQFPSPPKSLDSEWGWRWIEWLATVYNWLVDRNKYQTVVGSVTLTASSTTTVVTTAYCFATSKVLLMPTASGSASGFGTNGLYVSAKANGSFTLTHTDTVSTTRTYDYLIINT